MPISTRKDPSPPETRTPSSDALASLRIKRPDPNVRRQTGRIWKWLAGLLLVALIGYFGYQYAVGQGWLSGGVLANQSNWVPEIMQNRVEVRLKSVTIQKGRSADAVVVATGYLESRRQARIGAQAAGRIDTITFEEGDEVKKGDVLAELEHKDLKASLAASIASVARSKAALAEQEVAIEQALADKKRTEKLRETRGISESEYDLARFTYLSALARKDSLLTEISLAEARKQQAEQLVENMFIRAPFDGTVISKDAELGESILPGGMGGGSGRGSVATIADLSSLQIECDVQEDFISRVAEGQATEIAIDAVPSKKYHGQVRKIIPMGDRARATIKVQVEIENADKLLFPEMSGTVYFLPNSKAPDATDEPRIFCSTDAVEQDDAGNHLVWVVDSEKRAKKVSVKAGEDRDGKTEILSGLKGNERVVITPIELQNGTPVRVVE